MTWLALGLSIGLVLGYLAKIGVEKFRRWYEMEMKRGWFDF